MRPRTLELRSAFLALHALYFLFTAGPAMTDAGARKIQVARNLLGTPNQAPSPPRPPHRKLAAAAVRVGGTGTAAGSFYGGGSGRHAGEAAALCAGERARAAYAVDGARAARRGVRPAPRHRRRRRAP